MPTIREVIERVDEAKPNAFSEKQKLYWLTALDGQIAADTFLMDIVEIRQLQHQYPDGMDRGLLVEYPHDEVYDLWLMAKIDFENGEYNKYQNTMEAYNAAYRNFRRWFAEVYEPAQGGMKRSGRPTYYLTAYALAINAGYEGTLEEWLESLRGDKTELRYRDGVIQWRWRPADEAQEAEDNWMKLIAIDELLGETIAADLQAAQTAAQSAENSAKAAEEAKTKAEAAAGEELLLQVSIDGDGYSTYLASEIRQPLEDRRFSGAVLLAAGYVYAYRYDLSTTDTAVFERHEIGTGTVTVHRLEIDNIAGQLTAKTVNYIPEEADALSAESRFLVNLESEEVAASCLKDDDVKPGVTGALPITHGGHGATTAEEALKNLGAAKEDHTHQAEDLPTVPMTKGGTGATSGAAGIKNLLAAGNTVLSSYQYGTSLPAAGTKGRIFFKVVG